MAASLSAPSASEFRIMLLGKSEDKQTRLGNSIVGKQVFRHQNTLQINRCAAACGEWGQNPLTVVKTPDIFSLSEEMLRKEMKICVSLCRPGPNVLLLVEPSDFTEENRQTLKFILSLFGQDAFKHSMVINTRERKETSAFVKQLLTDCGGRYYNMSEDNPNLLMKNTAKIVHENEGTFLTIKAALNLVLCGRRGAEKTSAAKAILGVEELHSVSNSSQCVKHQGVVCGRGLSLVELPALYGKPHEEVMKESFRCISLCDSGGVHAFILVLPVGPLTDEDKGELEIIQNIFSSRVDDFTMILFTVDSDPEAPAVVDFVKGNKDIQELLQSCGGRSFVLNMNNKQQIPGLLEAVEKMRAEGSRCFTKDIFTKAQMEKVCKLQQMTDDEIQCLIQEQMETILKEKEEEMKRKEEELKRKHEEELKELKKKLNKKTEEETKLKETLMKKDEFINKERQMREREWEEEERRWQKILETSEKIVQSEKKHWETSEKKLEQWREEMKRDRDALDKERKDLWKQIREEDKQRLEEEKTSYRKLQEEYK